MVRHRVLVPTFVGSSPTTPAKIKVRPEGSYFNLNEQSELEFEPSRAVRMEERSDDIHIPPLQPNINRTGLFFLYDYRVKLFVTIIFEIIGIFVVAN